MDSTIVHVVRTRAEIREWLVVNIAGVLAIDPSAIDTSRQLFEYGLDSMQSISLSGDLGKWLEMEIEPTALWAYPTIDSLSGYLEGNLTGEHRE